MKPLKRRDSLRIRSQQEAKSDVNKSEREDPDESKQDGEKFLISRCSFCPFYKLGDRPGSIPKIGVHINCHTKDVLRRDRLTQPMIKCKYCDFKSIIQKTMETHERMHFDSQLIMTYKGAEVDGWRSSSLHDLYHTKITSALNRPKQVSSWRQWSGNDVIEVKIVKSSDPSKIGEKFNLNLGLSDKIKSAR